MKEDGPVAPSDVRHAFALGDEAARVEAVLETLRDLGFGPDSAGPAIEALLEGLERERSGRVLAPVWAFLASHRNEPVRAFAHRELDSEAALHRAYALQYLRRAYPEERRELFERMKEDPDPFVLEEVGRSIADLDPRAAVGVWLEAMYDAPVGLADEVLPARIGEYADADVLEELRRRAQNPHDELARLALWHAETWHAPEYLDVQGEVAPGPGYAAECPECGRTFPIREGHEGERVRCPHCSSVIVAPPDPRGRGSGGE